ncbi:bacterial low temperature requirement A protein-domain-containing protein [Aspergillus pseudoustus]|uniref:Bacterial low temperature requirement A protein-domain-containing protein n=1 Tax=Aspergillus pseudoustus TaxID=1810923 RepID=A0ABR4IH57_9EURO
MGRLPILKSPLTRTTSHHGNHVDEPAELNTRDESLFENPQFEHYEATSNIQLFFDLFFVANLSSFTAVHEINSRDTLASYIGFICVLWFTWCQVTLYDVRFATDSLFERVAHACHFGVMVGLAVIGPNFLASPDGWGPLQQLSLILMVSRVVLLCQYGSTLFFTWRYRKTRAPLIAVMLSLFVAVFIYLGISFAFYNRSAYDAYIAWYCLAVAEVVSNVAVAALWPAVSLWKTHLVERMTCLTLIILGEGIIGLTGTIGKIQTLDGNFTSTDIGTLISAVLIIYIIYQLYFDSVALEAISARRQHLSAILHFPFHLALCLAMEGTNQVLLWVHISADIEKIFNPFIDSLENGAGTPEVKALLTDMLTDVFSRFETTDVVFDEVQRSLNETLALPDTADPFEVLDTGLNAITEAMKTVIEGFGWETPTEIEGEGIEGLDAAYTAFTSVFKITFGYFTVCTGLILIFIAIFALLSFRPGPDSKHYRLRYTSIAVTAGVGLGIALLSLTTKTGAGENLGESPWAIAGLMLILLALLVVNHLPQGYYHAVVDKRV